ncbi:PepSY domain-containing protein [Thiorhodococcus fuscus]|uniref:PepSY domain-containing protein n=1 Tax=Thiorhodococcus fuscus TaxID=527200 RepID=A0ABW4Y9M6_9GAMM
MQLSTFILAALLLCMAPPTTWAGSGQGRQMSPDRAGEIARSQTGGRVLAVQSADGGYRVKVLTPDGQVRYVFVPNR